MSQETRDMVAGDHEEKGPNWMCRPKEHVLRLLSADLAALGILQEGRPQLAKL